MNMNLNSLPAPHPFTLLGIWYAVALHFVWTALLLGPNPPMHTTTIDPLSELWPEPVGLAVILAAVAVSAALALLLTHPPELATSFWRLGLLIPQQIILGISAAGAIYAMYLSEFADGITRSRSFIIADQFPAILAFGIHSVTIVYLAMVRRQWKS